LADLEADVMNAAQLLRRLCASSDEVSDKVTVGVGIVWGEFQLTLGWKNKFARASSWSTGSALRRTE